MRYTTIIDISELPALYRSSSCRLLYLHLVLKSGYHDDDRDLVQLSIRRAAIETGLTVSAARHALEQLMKAGLITRQGPLYQVRKFVMERTITKRAQNKKEAQNLRAREVQEEEKLKREAERAAYERKQAALAKQGKNSFMIYYESLLERAKAGDLQAAQEAKSLEKDYLYHQQEVAKQQQLQNRQ